jgi:MFS family permease
MTDNILAEAQAQNGINQDGALPADQGQGVQPVSEPKGGKSFAALGHRNYRLWFAGQTASLIGTWMQSTALGFLVFELTHSPAYLGYVGFASGIPLLFFTFFGGVYADRMPRRTLLLITQTIMMVLALILAALAFFGLVQPWHILLLALALGIATAFDTPARQSILVELVDRESLTNAIALNAMMFNLGIAFGPAVGGMIYALLGPAWCFTVNGLSFVAVIAALLMMRLPVQVSQKKNGSALKDLMEGFRYTAGHPVIRVLVTTAAVTAVFTMAFATLFPAWSVNVLGGDSTTNGFLQSARGLGAVVASMILSSLVQIRFKGRLWSIGTVAFPGLILVWALMRWLPLSLLIMGGVGFAQILVFNIAHILAQTHVADELRGRVMSIYSVALFGMQPIGALMIGGAAEAVGEPISVAFTAIVAVIYAIWLLIRVPRMRALD